MCNKFISPLLLFSIWCAICGGSLYAFGDWSGQIDDDPPGTRKQIYNFGQLGNSGVSIIVGLLYNYGGKNFTLPYAIIVAVLGIGVWMCATKSNGGANVEIVGDSALPAAIGFLLLQNAGCAVFQTGLFFEVGRTEGMNVGAISGWVSFGNGISALIWGVVYSSLIVPIFKPAGSDQVLVFMILFAVAVVCSAAVGLCVFVRPTLLLSSAESELQEVQNPCLTRGCEDGLDGSFIDLVSTSTASPSSSKSTSNLGQKLSQLPKVDRELQTPVKSMLKAPCFWCVTIQFAITQAVASVVFIENIPDIVNDDWNGVDIKTLLGIQSALNAVARPLFGVAMDKAWASQWRTERARFLLFTTLFVLLGCICVLFMNHVATSILGYLFIGLGFGGNFAVLPAVLASWYGRKSMALGFNAACVTFVGTSWIASELFEATLKTKTVTSIWLGVVCLSACGISLIVGTLLNCIRPCRSIVG